MSSALTSAAQRVNPKMLLLAHRGYHAEHPENTLDAFAAALERGADGIETDVRLSCDGHAVLIHDRVMPARSHGLRRSVAELTHHEVEQALGHHVPLLAEALDCFPEAYWNIEIKTPDALAETVRVVKPLTDRIRMLITSFRHDVIARCAESLPLDCGLLLANRPLDLAATMRAFAGTARVRRLVWDFNVLDEVVLWEASAAGWSSLVYGAVTAAEHAQCARLDLAGLITDYPDLVVR